MSVKVTEVGVLDPRQAAGGRKDRQSRSGHRTVDVQRSSVAHLHFHSVYPDTDIVHEKMPTLGEMFPNFTCTTTIGTLSFHKWLGDSWGILFSHPADFTPVCTTELARLVNLAPEFEKRNVKIIALSCDSVKNHELWQKDVKSYAGDKSPGFPFPIIDDSDRNLAVLLGMLDPDEVDSHGIPLTARAVFVIDPKKKYRLSILYPATIGRNFNEILRTIDAMQLTDTHKVATPADWEVGKECMILPVVTNLQLNKMFPRGTTSVAVPSGLPYMRKTPHP
ncbi:peroxiredoxin-6-like [Arctopsyche grandis]|uniref:peroxiredoxin-6-like n=1 Tax=Arctopsyche grandis TaxID=121162 RepID=UPI00406D7E80